MPLEQMTLLERVTRESLMADLAAADERIEALAAENAALREDNRAMRLRLECGQHGLAMLDGELGELQQTIAILRGALQQRQQETERTLAGVQVAPAAAATVAPGLAAPGPEPVAEEGSRSALAVSPPPAATTQIGSGVRVYEVQDPSRRDGRLC